MTPPLPRGLFPVTERWHYLDHAGVGPLPRPAADAVAAAAAATARDGSRSWDALADRIEEVRATAARLLGVAPAEVAFVKNTTEGLSFAANGLGLAEGDRVVVPDRTFPTVVHPWTALVARGVRVDRVAPVGDGWTFPVEAFAEAIAAGPPPVAVVASWVHYGRGARTDLAALADVCHDAGALLVVDAIQGLGVLPARVGEWAVDVVAAGGHKWLLSPLGTGLLAIRREHLDRFRVTEPGWNAVVHRFDYEDLSLVLDDTARRFEGGTPNAAGICGLGASLDLLVAAGPEEVWAHVEVLTDRACAGLEDAGARILSDRSRAHRSGTVVFAVPGHDPEAVRDALADRGVVAAAPRGGGVRVSPHGYSTEEDVDALVDAVADLARR